LRIKTLPTSLPTPYNITIVPISCSIIKQGEKKSVIHEFCKCITFQYRTFKTDITNITKMNEQIETSIKNFPTFIYTKTNLVYNLSSIYFVTHLHMFWALSTDHHQEVHRTDTTIGTPTRPVRTTEDSHLKRTISTNCCIHTV